MASLINKIKSKAGGDKESKEDEQSFSIQPHPAKSNDPADLQPSEGLRSTGSDAMAAHHARDPHVPSQEIRDNLPEPAGREELHARQAELNN